MGTIPLLGSLVAVLGTALIIVAVILAVAVVMIRKYRHSKHLADES